MSDSNFEVAFLTDPRQLGLKLVTLIESQQLASVVAEQYKWGNNTLDHVFSGSIAPGQESFGKFLHSEELKDCMDAGLQDLRDFWANWQATNLPAVEELPHPVVETTHPPVPPAAPVETVAVLNPVWSPDDSVLEIGSVKISTNDPSLVLAVWNCLDKKRGMQSWASLAKVARENNTNIFSSFKCGNVRLTKDRAQRWAKAVGFETTMQLLCGILDKDKRPATIFVAEAQVAEAQVAEAGVVIEVFDVKTSDKARAILVEAIESGKLNNKVAQKMASDMLKGQESDMVALAAFQTVWTSLEVQEVMVVLALKTLPNMDLFQGMSLGEFLNALHLGK